MGLTAPNLFPPEWAALPRRPFTFPPRLPRLRTCQGDGARKSASCPQLKVAKVYMGAEGFKTCQY
eukprot:10726031-Alexandrium_andersonii.AAC.1